MNEEQLSTIAPLIKEKKYAPKEVVMNEGDEGTFMFMIQDGSVSVLKKELKLSEHNAGDLVGLMSLLDNTPRSATVIAGEQGAMGYTINSDGIQQILSREKDSIVSTMLHNYIIYQQSAIRNTNALGLREARAKLEQEQKRVLSARFFVQMVLGLLVFTFLLGFLNEKTKQVDSTFVSFTILSVYALWSLFYVRISGLPLRSFGLTLSNLKPAFKKTMIATGGFLVFLFILKAVLITWFPDKYGTQLIEWYNANGQGSVWILIALYAVHAVMQEFIARGCIQGGLHQFISGKGGQWMAIFLATLMFSSFHLMIDMKLAVWTMVPGLFWGYLFYKEKNVLAVGVSHIIIGLVAFFVLNIGG
jgi:CRP-like cAMP-binding protein